jgi:hypothetical protein
LRIYVASSWKNEFQPGVVKRLRDLGHDVYDFRGGGDGWGGGGVAEAGGSAIGGWAGIGPNWENWASDDVPASISMLRNALALRISDCYLLVSPCGRSVVYGHFLKPDLMAEAAELITCEWAKIEEFLKSRPEAKDWDGSGFVLDRCALEMSQKR